MANYAYSNIYFHIVVSPNLICPLENDDTRKKVFFHISEILRACKNRVFAVNGAFDHAHILIAANIHISIEDLVSKIKDETKKFILDTGLMHNFGWQDGYAGVSVGLSEVKKLIVYIKNQEKFHKTTSFRNEYIRLLEEYEIEYDPNDLFDFHY